MDEITDKIDNLLFSTEHCDPLEQSRCLDQLSDVLLKNTTYIPLYHKHILKLFKIPLLHTRIIRFTLNACNVDCVNLIEPIFFFIGEFFQSDALIKSIIIKTFANLYCLVLTAILNKSIDQNQSNILFKNFFDFCLNILDSAISDSICVNSAVIELCQVIVLCGIDPPSKAPPLPFNSFSNKLFKNASAVLNTAILKNCTDQAASTLKKFCMLKKPKYIVIVRLLEAIRIITVSRPNLTNEMLGLLEILCVDLKALRASQFNSLFKLIKKLLIIFLRISQERELVHRCGSILQNTIKLPPNEIDRIISASLNHTTKSASKRKLRDVMFDHTCDEFTTFELSILEPCLKKRDRYLEAAVKLNDKYFDQILTPSLVADIVLCTSLTLPSSMPPGFANHYSDHVINLCHDARSDVINMMSASFAEANVGFGVNRVNRFISKFCKEEVKKTRINPCSEVPGIPKTNIQKNQSKFINLDISLQTFKRLLTFNPLYLTFPSYRHIYISAISSLVLLNNDEITQCFIEHICGNIRTNSDLYLAFLYKCILASENSSTFYEVYCRVFNLVLDRLKDEIKRCDQYFLDIIIEAPYLPSDFLPTITSFCSNKETLAFGVNVIIKMIKINDASFDWLGLLLDLSICDLKQSRETVIQKILDIYKSDDDAYSLKIDNFLFRSLEELTSMVSLDPERELQFLNVRFEFFFNMLENNHHHLHLLLTTYLSLNESQRNILMAALESTQLNIFYETKELFHVLSTVDSFNKEIIFKYLYLLNQCVPPFSLDLVSHVKNIYKNQCDDIRFVDLLLKYLTKHEIFESLIDILNQPEEIIRQIIFNVTRLSELNSDFAVTPLELVVAIHKLENRMEVKSLTRAITICLSQHNVFNQEILALTLQQLVDSSPIPSLTMRTMIQALGICPRLISFIMGLLQKLITKQVWKQPKLWHGFIKCCEKTKPQSFSILLQLPIRYLEDSFVISPDLHPQLVNYINNMSANQRALIHKAVLKVLEREGQPQIQSDLNVD